MSTMKEYIDVKIGRIILDSLFYQNLETDDSQSHQVNENYLFFFTFLSIDTKYIHQIFISPFEENALR